LSTKLGENGSPLFLGYLERGGPANAVELMKIVGQDPKRNESPRQLGEDAGLIVDLGE
jgi:hypothetical protein